MNGRVETRYEIGCDDCGLIDTTHSQATAFSYAKSVTERHKTCSGDVSIYDVMARPGESQLWRVENGHVRFVEYREEKAG